MFVENKLSIAFVFAASDGLVNVVAVSMLPTEPVVDPACMDNFRVGLVKPIPTFPVLSINRPVVEFGLRAIEPVVGVPSVNCCWFTVPIADDVPRNTKFPDEEASPTISNG